MPSHLSHVDYERIAGEAPSRLAHGPSNHLFDDSEDEEQGMTFADADAAFARAAGGPGAPAGDERTGLGVAGVLRRLRLWAREYGERGLILLEARELTRWCKATQRCGGYDQAGAFSCRVAGLVRRAAAPLPHLPAATAGRPYQQPRPPLPCAPCRAVEKRSASALAVQKPYGQSLQPGAPRIAAQQHRIRQHGLGPFANTTHGDV